MSTSKTLAIALLVVLAGAGALAMQSCAATPPTQTPGQPSAGPSATTPDPTPTLTPTQILPPPPT